jgi:glycosyltransferase involved in cell wall biosynthesis
MIVSIICPTYNEERYLQQTLEVFFTQQFHSFEPKVLICDVRSTYGTRKIVEEYANHHPCVRLIDNPHRKTPYALPKG